MTPPPANPPPDGQRPRRSLFPWREGQANAAVQRQRQLMNLRAALALQMVQSPRDLDILQQFCELVLQHKVAEHAWIGRPDAEGSFQTLAVAGSRSILSSLSAPLNALDAQESTPIALVWHDQKPYYSPALPATGAFAAWYAQLRQYRMQSAAVLPLPRGPQNWALLLLLHRDPEAWTGDSQMLLEGVVRGLSDILEDWDTQQRQMVLGAALKSALEGVVLCDVQRRVLYVNQSSFLMTGYHQDELQRHGMSVLQGPETDIQELARIDRALAEGNFYDGRLINYRRDGETFWNHLSIVPIRNRNGELTHFVGIQRDVSREIQLLEQLEYESRHDRLTGLANRRALDDELEVAMARAGRNGTQLALCMIDLDHFKPVNDLYGHEAGDVVLKVVGRRLRDALRRTDYVARLGGDEFVLLIEGYHNLEELGLILSKIEAVVKDPVQIRPDTVVGVRLSMGVCIYPHPRVKDMADLLRFADQALYASKARKTTRQRYWVLFDEALTALSDATTKPRRGSRSRRDPRP
ncbi:diguanylate cyclase [Acidithiobacillus caldus]|uniref:sensor domain-containing diguanylate cyclase n=1 Tax=Acidithiobacillus caldus TaxID=33059 RepID=UPI001C070E30|nr:sensor domain-containing diguanylate cyclase [Acidithiobacillus caldus]MBU2789656.1 diguanylate cyclase [Acidithiobacillus caldus]MBU2822028.1 diguanylate cyclase [Acidithiobacillus caldus]